jgi:hypothetical protein
MNGQTITADLDVNDGVYDEKCRQRISVPTIVEKVDIPKPRRFDEFPSRAFDDDKARLDAFAIELQNNPDAQGYIIMYQGTDRNSMRNRRVEVLSKRTLDYLVKARGIDPRRIQIVNWGTRLRLITICGLFRPAHSRQCRNNQTYKSEIDRKGSAKCFPFFFILFVFHYAPFVVKFTLSTLTSWSK